MEETIYNRQVTKLGLSSRVVDTENPERLFTAEQLDELYNYKVRFLWGRKLSVGEEAVWLCLAV